MYVCINVRQEAGAPADSYRLLCALCCVRQRYLERTGPT